MRTPYQQLDDYRYWAAHGNRSGIDLLALDDIIGIIMLARDAATLCACAIPQSGECRACKLRLALNAAGVPRA